ncbi:Transmembrane domain-containing protein, partial [Brazilian cedratvirus IHUMI]
MLDTLIIVVVFVLSYFSLVRKSSKDRQTLLLDRLERYLDKVEAKERKKNKKEEE